LTVQAAQAWLGWCWGLGVSKSTPSSSQRNETCGNFGCFVPCITTFQSAAESYIQTTGFQEANAAVMQEQEQKPSRCRLTNNNDFVTSLFVTCVGPQTTCWMSASSWMHSVCSVITHKYISQFGTITNHHLIEHQKTIAGPILLMYVQYRLQSDHFLQHPVRWIWTMTICWKIAR
jgi:hypothetical protein